MISSIFNTLFYNPLYNGLVFLINVLPVWVDLGVAIIIFTLIVKLVLFPLSQKSVRTQAKIRKIEPKIKALKEKYKDKQEQAAKTMELYREENINPFSGFLVLFIQIPIIFALYFIFLRGGFPEINTDILYSFVRTPSSIDMVFLGLVDISKKSLVIAFLAGLTQYIQARIMSSKTPKPKSGQKTSLSEDFARSMSLQMRYVFPVIIFFIAYSISAAVALYWTTSNIFMIGQELYVRRELNKDNDKGPENN